ncbi:GNAT family N-acetyltransferase [Rhodovulum sp. ES.010]|uniref:GNAT family N-acetyltransferase n=1 Tax=Rhodovulum sp. ES.010 TaxID=1882821 RepID=UPI0015881466|nr:GNAT family N-acetyltransferase [Rhodovulum sp. ES.010]
MHQGTSGAYGPEERAAWAPSPDPVPGWEQRLLAATTILAEARGRLFGFMTLAPDGHLEFAYVAPSHMGRGVGSALHAAVLDAGRDAGLDMLTTEASLVARPFLARRGWCETGRQSVIRNGVALTNFRMERTVGAGLASQGRPASD